MNKKKLIIGGVVLAVAIYWYTGWKKQQNIAKEKAKDLAPADNTGTTSIPSLATNPFYMGLQQYS